MMELTLQDLVSHEINVLKSKLKRKLGAKIKTNKLYYKKGCWTNDKHKKQGKWKIELSFDIEMNEKISHINRVSLVHD